MIYNNKIICIPKNDNHKRFLLGQHGTRELLAIGLNPSSANEHKLDPTSRNIKIIANNNDYDGWWLTNLYAFRTPKPNLLPLKADIKLGKETICIISSSRAVGCTYIETYMYTRKLKLHMSWPPVIPIY